MMYEIIAELESTVRDGKQSRIVKTGELPHFWVEATGPGEAIIEARKIVNPCGDANAVHIRCKPVTAGEQTAAA